MAIVAALFREIHRLRRHAAELRTRMEQGPRQLQLLQERLAEAEAAFMQGQETLKKLKVALHEGEGSLRSLTAQIHKYERQLNEIMSKKEFDALQHEIASARQKIGEIEDRMLAQMSELDERQAQLPELERAVTQARADVANFERNSEERRRLQTEELEKTLKELAAVEAQLPAGDILTAYQRRIKARGDDALAPVRQRVCSNCYTEVTAQTWVELQQGGLVLCKSCDRIIFLEE